jgi:hypothetical protein
VALRLDERDADMKIDHAKLRNDVLFSLKQATAEEIAFFLLDHPSMRAAVELYLYLEEEDDMK